MICPKRLNTASEPSTCALIFSWPRVSMRLANPSCSAASSWPFTARRLWAPRASAVSRARVKELFSCWMCAEMIETMLTSGMYSESRPSSVTMPRANMVTTAGSSTSFLRARFTSEVRNSPISRSRRSRPAKSATMKSRSERKAVWSSSAELPRVTAKRMSESFSLGTSPSATE